MVSKCSFDSLSLQERLQEFLISLFGLPAQLLFPLPPHRLQEETTEKTGKNHTRLDESPQMMQVFVQDPPAGRTRVCLFSSGASPSNTKIGLMRKKSSLQMRWKRVSRWAFWTLLPSRSLTPFTAWFSHMLMSGGGPVKVHAVV